MGLFNRRYLEGTTNGENVSKSSSLIWPFMTYHFLCQGKEIEVRV
jgi:hypothetical protein